MISFHVASHSRYAQLKGEKRFQRRLPSNPTKGEEPHAPEAPTVP